MDDKRPTPEPADEDSSGNRPPASRRDERETPLEDEHGRSRPGHPNGGENFRGND
ncbi:hypothetical protein AB0K15_10600 [Amycolatopsis sp. NPDC049253]|uniref:hypothetical protein n=1 Tax=Amycolatopsis sp. NPDC049253 TaxID=3155274 RepID=UPI00341F5D9F